MKKLIIPSLFIFLALVVLVGAMKPHFVPATVTPSQGHATVSIPEHAAQIAPGVFSLGTTIHKGRIVEGIAFIDYGKKFGKPGTECGNDICEAGENAKKCPADCAGGNPPEESTCYAFIQKGTKWRTDEPFVVNTANTRGLGSAFVKSNIEAGYQDWEDAAGINIVGTVSSTTDTLSADTSSPDDINEIYFADIAEQGAIGVSIVWYTRGGPPSSRRIVECDQVYDDIDFDWSEDCTVENCTSKMDFRNIVEHENGHCVGMDHPPDTCSEETMYAFSSFGEIKNIDLFTGDIAGINKLY